MKRAASTLVVLAAAAAVATATVIDPIECGFRDEATGSSFDLLELRRPNGDTYAAHDAGVNNFTYYWNVCNFARTPSDACQGKGASPVWQLWEEEDQCIRLGDILPNGEPDVVWSLYVPDDPTEGVKMQYIGGEECEGGNRTFTINFLCKAEEDIANRTVVETECHYEEDYQTVLACPLECPVGEENRLLCSGHGRCEMDPVAQHPRCLCNEGYYSADCSHSGTVQSRSSCDGTCGAMIFLMIILIIFIALVSAAWYNTVKKHNGNIFGGSALSTSLIGNDSASAVHEDPSAVAGSPSSAGAARYSVGHSGSGENEVELNLDDE